MMASVLQEAGYKTGLYTSPHLKDFRERIKVNGAMITEEAVVAFVGKHRGIIGSIKPSFFEMTVAMAFNYFSECKVDVAVIEVGLGGRLDSTNIINPVLSIITNIGHDHMDLLGNTIEKIAGEKAGIIKRKTPVIISETQPDTENVFKVKAMESDSPIYFADKSFSCRLSTHENSGEGRKYLIKELSTGHMTKGEIPLAGDYQSRNLQAVFTSFRILNDRFEISERNLITGIGKTVINTGLYGRWQILNKTPLTICDTGHNKEGLEYVLEQLKNIEKSVLHLILGFVNDKDLNSVLPLFPTDAKYYFTKASVPRALNEIRLMKEAEKFGLIGDSFPDVKTAYEVVRKRAEKSDLIFIGGSTFIVAEVI